MRRIIVAICLSAGVVGCTPTPGTERVSVGESANIASVGTQLSFQRAQAGIAIPLSYSAALQAAAQSHADFLSQTGNFGHSGAGGSTPDTRVRAAGYSACVTAENIARGQQDTASVLSSWMSSPDHRANILNPQVTQYGFAQAGSVSVLKLARPC